MTRQDDIRAEAESKKAEMIARARPADLDTEDGLLALHKMVIARREDPVEKQRYETLRDQLAARLKREGPRWFINDEGAKQFAYTVSSETVESNAAAIESLYLEGEISKELFEELCPRGVDTAKLKAAIARGANPRSRKEGIKPQHVARVARIVPYSTPYVAFVDEPQEERD